MRIIYISSKVLIPSTEGGREKNEIQEKETGAIIVL